MKKVSKKLDVVNINLQGMDLKSIKHHTALVPLFAIMGLGMTWVTYYCFRLASSTTDVNWSKKHEPQEYYRNKQFKFVNPSGIDFAKDGCKAPIYRD